MQGPAQSAACRKPPPGPKPLLFFLGSLFGFLRFLGLLRRFFGRFLGTFLGRLRRGSGGGLPCTLFLLLFEDFGLGQRSRRRFERRRFLRLGNRGRDRNHGNFLVADRFHAGRQRDFAEVN